MKGTKRNTRDPLTGQRTIDLLMNEKGKMSQWEGSIVLFTAFTVDVPFTRAVVSVFTLDETMGTFHTLQGGRSLTALGPSVQALYPKEKGHGCIEPNLSATVSCICRS